MDEETFQQLGTMSKKLHSRALSLSDQAKDEDIATLMSAMAVTMEAVRSIGETLNTINGPQGLGAAGD